FQRDGRCSGMRRALGCGRDSPCLHRRGVACRPPSMAGPHRVQRVYRATAVFWLTTTLLVVAANLMAVGWLAWRGAEPVTQVDTAPLALAYPQLGPEDLLELSRESTRDFMYEAFTQFRELPGDGRFVHIDANGFRRSK